MSWVLCRARGEVMWLWAACFLAESPLLAVEQSWELRGDVVAVGADRPRLVELRLRDGSTVKVPLDAFSEPSQAAILSAETAGKPATKPVAKGSRLAALDEAVSRCTTAEDALRAMQLSLAGEAEEIPPADAAAALARWEERAKRGEVRLGTDWVPPAVATSAAEAGDELLRKLATNVRLGNYKSFRENLDKASRVDPNSGRADFLLGLATAFGVGLRADNDRAIRYFAEVVDRESRNGAAWNNLAVCEIRARRFEDALTHFARAAECLDDPQVVVANVGAMVGGGSLTAKQAEAFAAVYERLVPEQAGQQVTPPPQSSLNFLSPFGQPINGQANFAEYFVAPAGVVIERVGGGMVVAPAVVLVPSESVFYGGSQVVRSAAEPTIDRPAHGTCQ